MSNIEKLNRRQLLMIHLHLYDDWKEAEGQLGILRKYACSCESIQEGIRELEELVKKRKQEYEEVEDAIRRG